MGRGMEAPPELRRLEEDLRGRYGGCMTQADVGRELGIQRHQSVALWLRDLVPMKINGRKKWRAVDVAQKMYRSRV